MMSRHVFGVHCHVVSIDVEHGTATFEMDHGTNRFTVPLFGEANNQVARMGIEPGTKIWLEATAFIPDVPGKS